MKLCGKGDRLVPTSKISMRPADDCQISYHVDDDESRITGLLISLQFQNRLLLQALQERRSLRHHIRVYNVSVNIVQYWARDSLCRNHIDVDNLKNYVIMAMYLVDHCLYYLMTEVFRDLLLLIPTPLLLFKLNLCRQHLTLEPILLNLLRLPNWLLRLLLL